MDDYEDINYNSDEEINKKQHARLLEDVMILDRKQYVKKPTRTEPTTHVSEFNLVKSSFDRKHKIKLAALTKSLTDKQKHVAITKKVKSATITKVLSKPLEKPQAERLKRTLGFEKTKSELNKWNSIVEKNRVASQLVFPLNQEEIYFANEKKEYMFRKQYKSELDKELEKLEPVVEDPVVEEKFPLTMEELIARRKEIAKLRAHQSYQEAKNYKQKKIKSKSYRKLQRKEKLKQQIKEFELLKKTDPEEALRKLEHLEKTRAEERMTLRHRSTGQWAKNKQVRAKYDKESRQALAQQLSLSRELTQKLKTDDSSDSELEEAPKNSTDNSNPWVSEKSNEFTDFVSGYRKYWNEKNNIVENNSSEENNTAENTNKKNAVENDVISVDADKKYIEKNKKQTNTKKEKNKIVKTKKTKIIKHCNSSWEVVSLTEDQNIENMFDDLEFKTELELTKKLNKLKKSVEPSKKRKITNKSKEEVLPKSDLAFKREKLRPEIDEELQIVSEEQDDELTNIHKTKTTTTNIHKTIELQTTAQKQNIDPNKYVSVKPVNLHTKLPDISVTEENEEDEDQRAFISEAFADDDIVDEFNKEKKDQIEADKPKDIDLTLPGWGSWGGKNIKISNRKRKRFIVKMPKDLPRRDENKRNLIINEHKDVKIKKHQVSELPFPFTSVKDFEASIRAPIGATFVPQTAFRRLIQPAVKTQKGAIIDPMSESILLKQKFTNNGKLVKIK